MTTSVNLIGGTKIKTETLKLKQSMFDTHLNLALSKINGVKLNKSTFDKCLNLALSKQTFARDKTQPQLGLQKVQKNAHFMPITLVAFKPRLVTQKPKEFESFSTPSQQKLLYNSVVSKN